jgi:hypothetical protein
MRSWLFYTQLPLLILLAGHSCRNENSQPKIDRVASVPVIQDSTQIIDFDKDIVPILKSRCSPCHFTGGKMYEKIPFDKSKTILDHKAGVTKRLKGQEVEKLKAYLDQEAQ